MTENGSFGGVFNPPAVVPHSRPGHEAAARILARYGGDPSSGSRTGAAVERFFSSFQRRFNHLFGKDGYRSLIEHAHLRAMRDHPLLEKWPSHSKAKPFFGSWRDLVEAHDPGEVWKGAVALVGHFLDLIDSLARKGEMDGLEEAAPWGGLPKGAGGAPSSPREKKKSLSRSHGPWRVLVMDRDLSTCEAIAQSLDKAPDFQVVDYGTTAEEVRLKVNAEGVDFVVASGHLPLEEILKVCRWFRRNPLGKVPSVVISGLPEDYGLILRFLEAGAASVTLEEFSVQGLRLTLRLLARGEAILPLRLQHLMSVRLSELAELAQDRGQDPDALSNLTARETEVLLLLEQGLSNRQIARSLYLSEGTVKSYVHQILRKLSVRDRKEAASLLRLGRALPR
jgi:DNA-binding NarL/FixJ family response regulator